MGREENVEFNLEEAKKLVDSGLSIAQAARQHAQDLGLEDWHSEKYRIRLSMYLRKKSKKEAKKRRDKGPKILVFDIETAPLKSAIWGLWNQNIGHNLNMLDSDWFMLTWSAKWLFSEEVMSFAATPEEIKREDDKRISTALWEAIEQADIVIAHNGKKFDVKRMNTRFSKWGLPPNKPYQLIDTLVHARAKFAISSNKLDYIAKFFEIDGKMDTGGYELWKQVLEGSQEAIDKMQRYNDQDVFVLEEVYLILRPWITPHPNLNLYIDDDITSCPSCLSTNLKWDIGNYVTSANTFASCRCKDCGAISRSRLTDLSKTKRQSLILATP